MNACFCGCMVWIKRFLPNLCCLHTRVLYTYVRSKTISQKKNFATPLNRCYRGWRDFFPLLMPIYLYYFFALWIILSTLLFYYTDTFDVMFVVRTSSSHLQIGSDYVDTIMGKICAWLPLLSQIWVLIKKGNKLT